MQDICPGWLATYGTRVLQGRDIDARDAAGALYVVLVNEARQALLPRSQRHGGVIDYPSGTPQQSPSSLIVGVVQDAVYRNLRDPIRPTFYQPLAQYDASRFPLTNISISVRATAGSPPPLSRSFASALTGVDRDLAFGFRPLAEQVRGSHEARGGPCMTV